MKAIPLTFVMDANIPISFAVVKRFDIFEKMFSTESSLIMSTVNLDECASLKNVILALPNFTELKSTNTDIMKVIKQYVDGNNIKLHTKNDADLHFIMAVIMTKPSFAVTNDKALQIVLNKIINRYYKKELSHIRVYHMADFLSLLKRSFGQLCSKDELVRLNMEVYSEDEIPSHYKNMTRHNIISDKTVALTQTEKHQLIFNAYKNNIYQLG